MCQGLDALTLVTVQHQHPAQEVHSCRGGPGVHPPGPSVEPHPGPSRSSPGGWLRREDAPEVLLGHGGQGLDVGPGLGTYEEGSEGCARPHTPSPKPGRGLMGEAPSLSLACAWPRACMEQTSPLGSGGSSTSPGPTGQQAQVWCHSRSCRTLQVPRLHPPCPSCQECLPGLPEGSRARHRVCSTVTHAPHGAPSSPTAPLPPGQQRGR